MLTGALRHGRKHREAMARASRRWFGWDLGFDARTMWWSREEIEAITARPVPPLEFNRISRTALEAEARNKAWRDMVEWVNRPLEASNSTGKAIEAMMGNLYARGTGAIMMTCNQQTGEVTAEAVDPYLPDPPSLFAGN